MNYRQKLGYTALGAMIMLAGLTIGVIVSPPLIAQRNGIFDEIECSKLTVAGPQGKIAMHVSTDPTEGTDLQLYDPAGTPRVVVRASTDGSFMQINPPSDPSIGLFAVEHGTGFIMKNAQGKELINITGANHMRHLTLHNPDGKLAVALASIGHNDSNVISVYNTAGKRGLNLTSDDGTFTGITLYDKADKIAATLAAHQATGKNSLIIYGAGQPVWTAP